ncbi:MAG: O-antigen ligase family protein [Planctomycetota bacterium]
MIWALLFLWLAVFPIAGWHSGLAWQAHVATSCLLGLLVVPRLWRRAAVPKQATGWAVGYAVVSLGLALVTAPADWPAREMQWAALTGLAHAGFFLFCLQLLPSVDAPARDAQRARLWLGVLLVAILLGQAGWVLFGPAPDGDPPRPSGTLGNPNALATVVAACGLALFGLLRQRPAALALALPLVPLVLVTRSRGAVLAAGLTLLLLVVRQRRWRLLLAGVAAAALLLVVPNPLRERVLALQSEDVFSRPFLWGAALESISEHPTGIGPAMNRYVFPAHTWVPERPWLLFQRHTVGLTHNVFLTLTLEWGWLAGASLLALLVITAARLARRPRDEDPLRTGAALGATVMLVELQVDGLEQNPAAFSLFLLFAAVVWARLPPRARGGAGMRGRPLAVALALLVVAVSGVLAWRSSGLRAQELAQQALAAHADGTLDVDEVRAALRDAERGLPNELRPARMRFDFEHALARALVEADAPASEVAEAVDAAWAALDRARAANGLDPSLPADGARLAVFLYRNVERRPELLERQLDLLQERLALDPLDVEGHWQLALEAQRAGRPDLVQSAAAAALRLEPDYAYAWFVLGRLHEAAGSLERALHAYVRAEEAVLNCHIKARVAHPRSRAFYVKNLEKTDLAVVRERIHALRLTLYF